MYVGATRRPMFASTPYALVMSTRWTSLAPSVSERPMVVGSMGVVMPMSDAVWIVSSMPEYSARNFTAGTFRDSRMACLMVTGPWYWRSAFSGQYPHADGLMRVGSALPPKSVRASRTTVAAVAPFLSAVT